MTIHLQKTAENTFLEKFVRISPKLMFGRLPSLVWFVPNTFEKLSTNMFLYINKENRRRQACGQELLPLQQEKKFSFTEELINHLFFVTKIEVQHFGSNPPVRIELFSTETGLIGCKTRWNVLVQMLEDEEEAALRTIEKKLNTHFEENEDQERNK